MIPNPALLAWMVTDTKAFALASLRDALATHHTKLKNLDGQDKPLRGLNMRPHDVYVDIHEPDWDQPYVYQLTDVTFNTGDVSMCFIFEECDQEDDEHEPTTLDEAEIVTHVSADEMVNIFQEVTEALRKL